MAEETQLNREIISEAKTEINHLINQIDNTATEINPIINQAENVTVLNTEISAYAIVPGQTIGSKYTVLKKMDVVTGEADLYLCTKEGSEFAAKIYRRKIAVKPEITQLIKDIDSPYVAKIYETGEINGFPFEILPYFKNGSLQGKRFTYDQLKNHIIPSLNEGLNVLHSKNIIHKDLKPSNIMLLDNNMDVAIIDFGISSVRENNSTVIVTKTGMTPEYSAPETFRNLFLAESDYYSLGITLYELFCGYTPYKNMSAEEIAQFTAVQRIPFPADMPQELQDLIFGVTYFDITNRSSKSNPNRRWTYAEVDNWCKGIKQIIPGEGTEANSENAIPPYSFLGQKYKSVPTLASALANNWENGKKQLYRGLLSGFFKNFNPEIAGYCMDAEEEAAQTVGRDDIIFWRLLYKICPELSGFYWMGKSYESLPALGRDMLEKLWQNDKADYAYWDSILKNKLLTNYIAVVKYQNRNLESAAEALETSHNVRNLNKREKLMNYYTMAYLLSGQKLFAVGDKRLKSIPELTAYMKGLLESSYEEFERFCHSMIDYDDTLDVQLESWLIALGKRNELSAWRNNLNR